MFRDGGKAIRENERLIMPLFILLVLNFFMAMLILVSEGYWFIAVGYALTVWILLEAGSNKTE